MHSLVSALCPCCYTIFEIDVFVLFGSIDLKEKTNPICIFIERGSYMSAYVLLNLLKELKKRDKM